MRVTKQVRVTGLLGLCLLGVPLIQVARKPPAAALSVLDIGSIGLRPLRGPSDRALQEARLWRFMAMREASEQVDAFQEWDPKALAVQDLGPLRRQLLIRDRAGYLRRAREAARRAEALARTPDDAYQAAGLLALIECDAGRHDLELQQARRMMALAPRNELSLIVLRRAARCNGLESLAQ